MTPPRPLSPRVVIEPPMATKAQASEAMPTEPEHVPEPQVYTPTTKASTNEARKMRRKERRRLKQAKKRASAAAGAARNLTFTGDIQTGNHAEPTTSLVRHTRIQKKPSGASEVAKPLALWVPAPESNKDMVSGLSIQHQPRRKKKRKNKLFLGANGPVYSTNVLDIPFGKPVGPSWR